MDFQTPFNCCKYMVSLIPKNAKTILEPTPGEGNLVSVLKKKGYNVRYPVYPENFWQLPYYQRYDSVVMNPPFSPMKIGYKILYKCMELSDSIIALMPWLTIINSEKRTSDIINYGLKSVTHLPRSMFKGARVQTCILEMNKGYKGNILFHNYGRIGGDLG